MEALAMVGGIDARGDASKVKLIRQDPETKVRTIYQLDLSTIDGLPEADIVVQANDIIYVEPLPLLAREFVQEIAPVVSLITTTALLITLVLNVQ
jgi:polysaccharide export outer membrane protein